MINTVKNAINDDLKVEAKNGMTDEATIGMAGGTANGQVTTLPLGKIPQMRVVAMPQDANMHGDVFGGWIMSQVDLAGAVCATRRANGRVVTIAVNSFLFKQPVFVGDLLTVYADIVKVGRTSITVDVECYAERNQLEVETVKVTEATLTYVATDENRRSRSLPSLADLLT